MAESNGAFLTRRAYAPVLALEKDDIVSSTLRIGIIGAGDNTRKKHIPGLLAIPGVEILAVCNRREESTAAVAREFNIPRVHKHWQDAVANPDVDAIVNGTWPYLHCPIALAALEAGKHLLTEARMAMNASEARLMLAESRRRPELVAQIVPSPFGLAGERVMRDLVHGGFLGELREYHVYSHQGHLADPDAPLSWRQDERLSGCNMLTLGILHETVLRWLPPPVRVIAQTTAFIPERIDATSGLRRPVETPDSVQALTVLESGARGIYSFSGVLPAGDGIGVKLYGSRGSIHYDFTSNRIFTTRASESTREAPIHPELRGRWQVEEDFVRSIRERAPVTLTNFEMGVRYMEFTEAVARSSISGEAVELPLESLAT
jgi:predicted dehydrogenase